MKRLRDPRWMLTVLFLAIMGGVPLVQTLIEVRQDQGIRALDLFGQAPTAANLRAYERSLESANWFARETRPWMQWAWFKWLGDGGEKAVFGKDGWYFYKPGLEYMVARPGTAKSAAGTNDPIAAILDFRQQLAAQGIRLLVMPVPNKDSIYPDRLTSRAEPSRTVVAPRTREILERLRASQVEVVDLFKEFGEARRPEGSTSQVQLYLAQDTHWSPAGIERAAKLVAQRLIELGWARPGSVRYREKTVPVQRVGDILRMLQVPMIERSVTPETVPCMQVVREDNQEVYKDAADAEILVLGDSFMRIFQQDEPRSAGFIAHLAKELGQPMMSLVNDGGGSTLVRQELRARPIFLKHKKVVIWEFVERDIGIGVEGWKPVQLSPIPADSTANPASKEPPAPASMAPSAQ